jgi:THO complex subunit 1
MPSSKGKVLPLLRIINTLLRSLAHMPREVRLRARVHLFASSAISVSDKSAINMRGEYAPITTTWEGEEEEQGAEGGEGDVKMDDKGESCMCAPSVC